ncbi:MAG: hypothetical protein KZQ77_05590 [Candidatus Thiodiazotropha sp. (ex Notomyrtea botanica)]|nr:hypothetical protein [Candidatus Thiodiazotropha sp. (ex Notomyrtea botanica)]
MMNISPDVFRLYGYAMIVAGLLLLLINHITVTLGDPWLIPGFLRLY